MTKLQFKKFLRYLFLFIAGYSIISLIAGKTILPFIIIGVCYCIVQIDLGIRENIKECEKEQNKKEFDNVQTDVERLKKSALPSNGVND